MGYKYKLANGRKILCEKKHVVASKIVFLRKYLQFQNSCDLTFVYLDETWIYQNGSNVRRWLHDTDMKSNPPTTKSEGKRFTILHVGCKYGFLNGYDLILDTTNNDMDYHKTTNAEIFQNWVIDQLIPALTKLPSKCVVVMDNAPYHSVQLDKAPTLASKKNDMIEWLVKHNVSAGQNLTKNQLWDKIKPFRQDKSKRYVVDEILKEHGHEVLRLPPYHCQYNPIEMAWGFCKGFYNKHINSQPPSKDKVANLWRQALSKCTPDMWKNYSAHCEKLISDDWAKHMGTLSFENIPPIIISLGESESESDDSVSDNDDSESISDVMEVEY
jgi:transposase